MTQQELEAIEKRYKEALDWIDLLQIARQDMPLLIAACKEQQQAARQPRTCYDASERYRIYAP